MAHKTYARNFLYHFKICNYRADRTFIRLFTLNTPPVLYNSRTNTRQPTITQLYQKLLCSKGPHEVHLQKIFTGQV